MFKEFARDFDELVVPPEPVPNAEGELLRAMQELRLAAQDKRLDISDSFESYAGKGREGQLGIMPKNRFQAAMADMFKGRRIPMRTFDLIAMTYGTGDPDPREPGEFLKVRWKQFAEDFDSIDVPVEKTRAPFDERMVQALSDLKGEAVRCKLDMTDAFEEYAGAGVDYNLGLMPKSRFRSLMAVLFSNVSLSNSLLDRICDAYPAGDADPAGGFLKVKWREFAVDFDEQVPAPWHSGKAPPARALG